MNEDENTNLDFDGVGEYYIEEGDEDEISGEDEEFPGQDPEAAYKQAIGATAPIPNVRNEARSMIRRIVNCIREIDMVEASYRAEIVSLGVKRVAALESGKRKSGMERAVKYSQRMDYIETLIKRLKAERSKVLKHIAEPWDLYTGMKGTGAFIAAWLDTGGSMLTSMKRSNADGQTAYAALAEWKHFVAYSRKLKEKRLQVIASKHRFEGEGVLRSITEQELWWLQGQ